jgi:hypothetical protein
MKIARICILLIILNCALAMQAFSGEPVTSDRFSLYYIPSRTSSMLDSFLTENDPPMVVSVKASPEEPGASDNVIIEAEIKNDSFFTTSHPLLANIFYSIDDGKTWKTKEMDQISDSPDLWHAELPALGKPGTVRYYFTAKDDGGNYLIELPVTKVEWGGIEPPKLTGALTDDNDDSRMVFDDLDILQTQVGYDGGILYFAMKVEGNISGGTVSPFNVFVYSVGIYTPESFKSGTIRTDYVLEHSQHAQFLLFPVIGLLDTREKLTEVRAADARYYSNGSWLYMRFKQDGLKNKKFDKLRIIFGTAYSSNYDPLMLTPDDTTGFINIVRSDRSYEVK